MNRMWKWTGLVGLGGGVMLAAIGCQELLIGAAVVGVGSALLGALGISL